MPICSPAVRPQLWGHRGFPRIGRRNRFRLSLPRNGCALPKKILLRASENNQEGATLNDSSWARRFRDNSRTAFPALPPSVPFLVYVLLEKDGDHLGNASLVSWISLFLAVSWISLYLAVSWISLFLGFHWFSSCCFSRFHRQRRHYASERIQNRNFHRFTRKEEKRVA